jgi:NAD(P)-dependent dehydrogenase (short-subunit alcohol dehydrogenase family)
MMRLTGRFAIITGASQGLGEEIAKQFVAEGASVFLCARSEPAVQSVAQRLSATARSGQKVLARSVDISKRRDVDQLVAEALDTFKRIDILVNNAGVHGPVGRIHEIDWDAWVDAININLIGLVYACRAVTPTMIGQRFGKIINLSGGGATNPMPRMTSYAASKAAVVRFTESLALDLKAYGIDVNSFAPGALDTRLLDEVLDAGPEKVGAQYYERMRKIKQQGGTPLSVGASLAVYLASDESNGITARLIAAVWDKWATLHERAKELDASDIYTLRRIVAADRGRKWDD